MMEEGGNGQLKDFFAQLNISGSSLDKLYLSKGAGHYRLRLKERVQKILSGELNSMDSPRVNHNLNKTSSSLETYSTPRKLSLSFPKNSIKVSVVFDEGK